MPRNSSTYEGMKPGWMRSARARSRVEDEAHYGEGGHLSALNVRYATSHPANTLWCLTPRATA